MGGDPDEPELGGHGPGPTPAPGRAPGPPQGPGGTHSLGTQAPGGPPPQIPPNYDYYYDDDGYSEADATSLVRGRSADFYAEVPEQRRSLAWNTGVDLGLLLLRLGLGALFLLHGAQKLFGAFGGPGTDGFAASLSGMGFQQAATLSLVTGVTETAAGALLILGLLTPLAAAGVLGVLISAVATNLDAGFFAPEGFEFEAALGVMALAVLFAGPGRVAADHGRVWFRRPVLFGFLGLIIAGAAAAAVLVLLYQP